jgi:hypothetical protein
MLDQGAPQAEKPSIDVIISDLAAPETGESSHTLASVLQKMALQRRHLLLWGFRSGYLGEYAAASSQCVGKRVQLKQGQTLPGLGRPFYLLVSTPDADSLKRWVDSLSAELLPAAEFLLASPPIQVRKLDLPKQWLPKGIKSKTLQEDKSSESPKRVYSIFTVADSKPFEVAFTWMADLNLPFDPNRSSKKATQITAWPAKEIESADDLGVKDVAFTHAKAGGHLSYTVKFPAVNGKKWRVYRLPLNAGDGNTPQPAWISDWSTTSDCEATSGNHTLNLKDAGWSLSQAFLKDRPFLEHYIAVGKE